MIQVGFSDPIQWRVTTRRHDWLSDSAIHSFIDSWVGNGLIGRPSHIEAGDDDRPMILGEDEPLADAILRVPRNVAGGLSCIMRGEQPGRWWMSIVLSEFNSELGRTSGFSIINLNLPRRDLDRRDEGLLKLFEDLHRPNNTEYASIHPEFHAAALGLSSYVPALTIEPMFAGMLWANFLGPGIVELFRRETIDSLDVARRRWFGPHGVFLAVSEHLGSIDSAVWEKKLIQLTEAMRLGAI